MLVRVNDGNAATLQGFDTTCPAARDNELEPEVVMVNVWFKTQPVHVAPEDVGMVSVVVQEPEGSTTGSCGGVGLPNTSTSVRLTPAAAEEGAHDGRNGGPLGHTSDCCGRARMFESK